MAESTRDGHPTVGRRRKHKSPAVSSAVWLPLPWMPGYLRDSSGDEAENEAQRPCSTSTTPKSGRGMGPDECDRLMGIGAVDFSADEKGFGDGDLTDTENPAGRVADDSETPIESHSGIGSCLGVADSSRACGSASLMEIFSRLPKLNAPAACASQGAAEVLGAQANPRQVMSPNSSLTLPQDPFGFQAPKPEAGTDARDETSPKCEEGACSTSAPSVKVQQEVKEEPESAAGSSRTSLPAQFSQASFPEVGRPCGPERVNL